MFASIVANSKDLHLLKHSLPISVTLLEMLILLKFKHPIKAPLPIALIDFDISIDIKLVTFTKALSSIISIFSGIIIVPFIISELLTDNNLFSFTNITTPSSNINNIL